MMTTKKLPMDMDESEKHNLQAEQPEVVRQLTKLPEKYVAEGRSTPGVAGHNDSPVDIWK